MANCFKKIIIFAGTVSRGGAQLGVADANSNAAAKTGYGEWRAAFIQAYQSVIVAVVAGAIALGVLILAFIVSIGLFVCIKNRRKRDRRSRLKNELSMVEHGRSPFKTTANITPPVNLYVFISKQCVYHSFNVAG